MEHIISIAILCSIYAILGMSLNLIVGYAGLISVGHAAFFGIGAYSTAILTTKTGIGMPVSILIGMVITAIAALFIGAVLSRFRNDYYMLVSVGFNFIVFGIFLNWQQVTNGALGIVNIPRPSLFGFIFGTNILFLIFSLALAGLVYLASRFIVNSSFGRALKAIREDERTLQVFGYHVEHYKLTIYIIGAAMAAIAGSLFASYIKFIDPYTFTVLESVFIIAIIIFGGLANLRGAIIGAIVLVILPELLRFAGFPPSVAAHMRQLTYGVVLVVLMLYRPQGLIGEYKL
jgi:branched-chain amino acid transport system permease protein